MARLTGAFDASGDKKSSVLIVAGFVSSENDWQDFSEAWSARLSKDGIEYFRAADAASYNGPFEHWQKRDDRDDIRKALFGDLMDILKSHVYHRFGCAVINEHFDRMSEEIRGKFQLTSYTLASLSCEKQFRKWVLREFAGSDPKMPVRMVFEHGDEGFGDLSEWIEAFPGTIPVSREYKKDAVSVDGITRYGFIPLQAADWLAYELSLFIRQLSSGRIKASRDVRWPFQQFMRILGDAGTYYAKEIKDAEAKLNALKIDPEWDSSGGIELLSKKYKPSDQQG
jgi:hypothetical protein